MREQLPSDRVCGICHRDCSEDERVQNPRGIYYHLECWNDRNFPLDHQRNGRERSRGSIAQKLRIIIGNLVALAIALYFVVGLEESPMAVAAALIVVHFLKAFTVVILCGLRSESDGLPQIARVITRPPSDGESALMAGLRENPDFDKTHPLFGSFVACGFMMLLLGFMVIKEVPGIALSVADLKFAAWVGALYFAQALFGQEIILDPEERTAGNLHYNSSDLGIFLLSVFPVAMILLPRPDLATRFELGADWLIMALFLFLRHFFSLYHGLVGPSHKLGTAVAIVLNLVIWGALMLAEWKW